MTLPSPRNSTSGLRVDAASTFGTHLYSSKSQAALLDQTENSRALLKRLTNFTREKAELDATYGRTLHKLIDKLVIHDQSDDVRTFEQFINAFRELCLVQAAAFEQASQTTSTAVLKSLTAFVENHKKATKQCESELQKANKALAQHQEALDHAKAACTKAFDDLIKAKELKEQEPANPSDHSPTSPVPANDTHVETPTKEKEPITPISPPPSTSPPPPVAETVTTEKKSRFGGLFKREVGTKLFASVTEKMNQSINQSITQTMTPRVDVATLSERAMAADTKYIQAVKSLRSYRSTYDSNLTHLLDQLQEHEESCRSTATSSLHQYVATQNKLFTSTAQHLQAVQQVSNKVSPKRDSKLFILAHRSEAVPASMPIYECPKGHPQYQESISATQALEEANLDEEQTQRVSSAKAVLTELVDKLTGYSTSQANTSSDNSTGHQRTDGQELDDMEIAVAQRLFGTHEGRLAFATVVNLQRNRGQLHLSPKAFEGFGQLIMSFLDSAHEAMHVQPIQLVMILSQSLWRDQTQQEKIDDPSINPNNETKKVFLSTLIRSHPVWLDAAFWEESFFAAIRSKLTEEQLTVAKWHTDAEQLESLHARKQAAFATLSTFAMNMNEFGMSQEAIGAFVEKQAPLNELDQDQIEMIRQMDAMKRRKASERDSGSEAPAHLRTDDIDAVGESTTVAIEHSEHESVDNVTSALSSESAQSEVDEPIDQSISQSIDQSVNQMITESTDEAAAAEESSD